jgi:hypothetical protein
MDSATGARPAWRAVAVPTEHGGWGLTLEPVLLGLMIAPSMGGLALGVAAFLAFLVRTPLKLAMVDRRRGRWLDRSRLAARIAAAESVAIALAATLAVVFAGSGWLLFAAAAVPFVAVESWYDVRSRGRRLVPELSGSAGIAAVAGAIIVAGGGEPALAVGAWVILAARSVGAIAFVRLQIVRLRAQAASPPRRSSDLAQVAAVAIAAAALALDPALLAGFAGVVGLALMHLWWTTRPPVAAKVLGIRQMALGLALVVLTAGGVLWGPIG